MIRISNAVELPDNEVEIKATRSSGPGGQHVNKVSTAIQLRFDIAASSLPDFYKDRLLAMSHHNLTEDGQILIKVSDHRSQEKNKDEAMRKFVLMIRSATIQQKKRKPTKPTKGSKRRRLDSKKRQGEKKTMRRRVDL